MCVDIEVIRSVRSRTHLKDPDLEECCWICMSSGSGCSRVCKCSSIVHPLCMAMWQFERIGTSEETHCRFCDTKLKDWRSNIISSELQFVSQSVHVTLAFTNQDGQAHYIRVTPAMTYQDIIDEMGRIMDMTVQTFSFDVRVAHPINDTLITLNGISNIKVALFCARVKKAKRFVLARKNKNDCCKVC